jgi:hypothetical protein
MVKQATVVMYHFHANLFALPSEYVAGEAVTLRGAKLTPLHGPAGGPPLFDCSLPASFESAQERLLAIERMDVEPDGYFLVAGGERQGNRWQIDGHLHELAGRLHRVEMSGSCPAEVFDALVACFVDGSVEIVYQLVREGVTLSERDFRDWATAETA